MSEKEGGLERKDITRGLVLLTGASLDPVVVSSHSSPDLTTILPFGYLACVLAVHMVCAYRLLRESCCTPQKENHALPAESTYFGFTSYSAR